MVREAIKKTLGTAGHSGLDVESWRQILASGNFGKSGKDLKNNIKYDYLMSTKILYLDKRAKNLDTFLSFRFSV